MVVVIAFIWLFQRMEDLKRETSNRAQLLEQKNAKLETWQDKEVLWVAEKQAANLKINNLNRLIDSLENLPPETVSYTSVSTETSETIDIDMDSLRNTLEPRVDTVKVKSRIPRFDYKSKWFDLSMEPYQRGARINYTAYDSLEFITYWDSQGWFKRDVLMARVKSHNPNTQFRSLNNFSATEPNNDKIVVSIGGGAGLNYNGEIGPHFDYSLLQLQVGYKLFSF